MQSEHIKVARVSDPMNAYDLTAAGDGLAVIDIEGNAEFASRRRHDRDMVLQMEGLQRIAHGFVGEPEAILQELVNSAVALCGADSAGISIERDGGTDTEFYHWVATAGEYTGFLNAILPRAPSACGICLERGRPQLFRVGQPFFDILGVEAPLVTDGLLLPWEVDGMRGTIFVMAHGRDEAFDREDCRLMGVLADFAALGVKQQRQQKMLVAQAGAAAAAAMANQLAHQINNPLQGLTNRLFLAAEGHHGEEARALGRDALQDLNRLAVLVKRLLALNDDRPI